MKSILITGKNSYIGKSVEKWLKEKTYKVDFLDLRDDSWRKFEFSKYDAVLHTAAITPFHSEISDPELYQKVNAQLTIELAQKAKLAKVSQFIFMSTMSVYSGSELKNGIISVDTLPIAQEIYGKSKLQAEFALNNLLDENFKIAIIRPPMIYGKGSKGNYSKLSYLARRVPLFPSIYNQRSMLHIDNLCEFIKQIIDREEQGLFFPQNREYVCTSDLVKEISKLHEKKIILTPLFNPFIKLLFKLDPITKLFGNLIYDKSLSSYDFEYQIRDFKHSIELTEK